MRRSIVAVHGLVAHPEFTWTTNDAPQQCPDETEASHRRNWLKDFLPTDFPNAEIMTFSYNADWFSERQTQLHTRADALFYAHLKKKGKGTMFVVITLVEEPAHLSASTRGPYSSLATVLVGLL